MKEKAYIEFDELFINLLITLRNYDIRLDKVPYTLIDKYGTILLNDLNNKNVDVAFELNNENIDSFLSRYSDYFEDSKTDGSIIILKNMKQSEMVFKYQGYLPSTVLRSIYSRDVITKTLEAYMDELVISHENTIAKIKNKIKSINEEE